MNKLRIQCGQCTTIQQFHIQNAEYLLNKTVRYTCRNCKTQNHFKVKKNQLEWSK